MKLKDCYDVVVIGSGAGGGTAAEIFSRYVEKGLSVLVLEGGPFWKKENFNQKERDMSRIYFNRGAIFSKRLNIAVAAGRVVGGSTAVYTGVSFRPPEEVWQKWKKDYGLDFFNADFVQDTLDEIEEMIHVAEPPPSWDNDNNRLFREGCEKLDIPVKRLRLNLKGCQQQGLCNLGCTSGGKQGTLEVQIPLALSRGIELVHNAWVDHITPEEVVFSVKPAWPFTEANVLPEGNYKVKAKNIVLAAGSLHTPPLLLRSQKYLRTSPKNIGRYLTLHPAFNVNAIYPQVIKNDRGFPKTYYSDAFSDSEGYYLETSFYFPGVTAKNIPHMGKSHEEMMKKYRQMMSILLLSHDPARFYNRVKIDRRGNTVLDYRVDEEVQNSLIQGLRRAAAVFLAAGCEEMVFPACQKEKITPADAKNLDKLISKRYLNLIKTPLSSAHPQGGARMGADPKKSVVSPEGKLHNHDNIFIADASLFPTSVKVNPYETVMLLSHYVAKQVVKRAWGG